MRPRAFYHGFRAGVAVFFQQLLLQAAGIDADADGNVPRSAGVRHGSDVLFSPDIAGIDADFINAALRGHQCQAVIKMDIRHERHIRSLPDRFQRLGGTHIRNRKADNVAPRRPQRTDLGKRGFRIPGFGVAHALHRNRSTAADFQAADSDLSGLFPFIHLLQSSQYHSA